MSFMYNCKCMFKGFTCIYANNTLFNSSIDVFYLPEKVVTKGVR